MLSVYRFSNLKNHDFLIHLVTKKDLSKPYNFSLALHTGEDKKSIFQNRKILEKKLNSKNILRFIVANQTHSNHIKIIKDYKNRGWDSTINSIENCDALITNIPNVILTILTADCVPILLYDTNKQVVAAIHAGWKGTKSQISSKTVQLMIDRFNSNPVDIEAAIAPAIGECCYEVEEDVAKYFLTPKSEYCKRKKDGKFMLNLPKINKQQLIDIGLKEENIEMSNICTSCNSKDYFSYRQEKGCSGRFMSMIGIKED